jgi:hypothetical protein
MQSQKFVASDASNIEFLLTVRSFTDNMRVLFFIASDECFEVIYIICSKENVNSSFLCN